MAIEKQNSQVSNNITDICKSLSVSEVREGIHELQTKYIQDICFKIKLLRSAEQDYSKKYDSFEAFFTQLKRQNSNSLRQKMVEVWESLFYSTHMSWWLRQWWPTFSPIYDPVQVAKILGNKVLDQVSTDEHQSILADELRQKNDLFQQFNSNLQGRSFWNYQARINTLTSNSILDKLEAKLLLHYTSLHLWEIHEEIRNKKESLFRLMKFIEDDNILDVSTAASLNATMDIQDFTGNKKITSSMLSQYLQKLNQKVPPIASIARQLMNISWDNSYFSDSDLETTWSKVSITFSQNDIQAQTSWLRFLETKLSLVNEYYSVIAQQGLEITSSVSNSITIKLINIRSSIGNKLELLDKLENNQKHQEIQELYHQL